MAKKDAVTYKGAPKGTKYPSGPLKLHKSIAIGADLGSAQSEGRVGGSKSDKSHGTNR